MNTTKKNKPVDGDGGATWRDEAIKEFINKNIARGEKSLAKIEIKSINTMRYCDGRKE